MVQPKLRSGPRSVLLVGDYKPSLAIVRELSKSGYRLIVGQSDMTLAALSRHTAEVWHHPPLVEFSTEFLRALIAFLSSRPDIEYLFPVQERYLIHVLDHASQIPAKVAASSPTDTVMLCLDKERSYRLAQDSGLPVPRYAVVSDLETLHSAAQSIGFPCIAKPNDLRGYNGIVYRLEDDEHLKRAFPAWPDEHRQLVVQRFADGRRHTRHFIAYQGRVLQYVDVRTLRTSGRHGTGGGQSHVSVPPMRCLDAPCASLLGEMNFSGAGSAQFLVDDDTGSIAFMEINPRLGGSSPLSAFCGLHQARALIELSDGSDLRNQRQDLSYPVGKRASTLHREISQALRNGGAGQASGVELVRRLKRAVAHGMRTDLDYAWSWDDPFPALTTYMRTSLSLGKRTIRRAALKLRPG